MLNSEERVLVSPTTVNSAFYTRMRYPGKYQVWSVSWLGGGRVYRRNEVSGRTHLRQVELTQTPREQEKFIYFRQWSEPDDPLPVLPPVPSPTYSALIVLTIVPDFYLTLVSGLKTEGVGGSVDTRRTSWLSEPKINVTVNEYRGSLVKYFTQ